METAICIERDEEAGIGEAMRETIEDLISKECWEIFKLRDQPISEDQKLLALGVHLHAIRELTEALLVLG